MKRLAVVLVIGAAVATGLAACGGGSTPETTPQTIAEDYILRNEGYVVDCRFIGTRVDRQIWRCDSGKRDECWSLRSVGSTTVANWGKRSGGKDLLKGCPAPTAEREDTTAVVADPSRPEATPSPTKQRVRDALGNTVSAGGYAGDIQIEDVSFEGAEAQVTAKTPEGGLQGASCGDLNDGAGAIFKEIYNDGGWNGGVAIVYKGGLVSTATGKDLPDVNTGIFTMPALRAQQINWANDDELLNIDWSMYRDYCHPALQ